MKKFMKALAFATVMCMLLSTAAFATNPAATYVEDYKLTVTVTASETEQVALLVLKAGTVLANATGDDVYYVGQDAAVDGTATFAVALNSATLGEEKKVDIYAGYASNTGNAVSVTGVSVVEDQELTINLADMQIIPDVEVWAKDYPALSEIEKPEREIATMVLADVNLNNLGNDDVINKVGWIFNISDGTKRYVDYDITGLEVIDGTAKIGVSFTNGWKEAYRPADGSKDPLTISTAELYLKVNNVKTPVVKAENN